MHICLFETDGFSSTPPSKASSMTGDANVVGDGGPGVHGSIKNASCQIMDRMKSRRKALVMRMPTRPRRVKCVYTRTNRPMKIYNRYTAFWDISLHSSLPATWPSTWPCACPLKRFADELNIITIKCGGPRFLLPLLLPLASLEFAINSVALGAAAGASFSSDLTIVDVARGVSFSCNGIVF